MKKQVKSLLNRLKKPSVLLSIVSQVVSIFILCGFRIDQKWVMEIATIVCSIFVTVGILSNPDTESGGYGDDFRVCPTCGGARRCAKVGGCLLCTKCGTACAACREHSVAQKEL